MRYNQYMMFGNFMDHVDYFDDYTIQRSDIITITPDLKYMMTEDSAVVYIIYETNPFFNAWRITEFVYANLNDDYIAEKIEKNLGVLFKSYISKLTH